MVQVRHITLQDIYGVKPFNIRALSDSPESEAGSASIEVEPGSKRRNYRIGLAGPFLDPIRLHLEVNAQRSAEEP